MALMLFATSAEAQWLNHPTAGIPRLPDGKPNLSAPAPRTQDGKPDLSGIWRTDLRAPLLRGVALPFQAWAESVYRERRALNGRDRPSARCLPSGIPRAMVVPELPFKIVQTSGFVLMLFEEFLDYRQIFTDGRSLPVVEKPSRFGYSAGRWEEDRLIVTSTGFNDFTWLGSDGFPRTEALRLTEKKILEAVIWTHGGRIHHRRSEGIHAAIQHHCWLRLGG
jgi:hypothetical protein